MREGRGGGKMGPRENGDSDRLPSYPMLPSHGSLHGPVPTQMYVQICGDLLVLQWPYTGKGTNVHLP